MTMIYRGVRESDGTCSVTYGMHHRRALPMRLNLSNHSPTGFEWGYGGSGPAQLALALLAHALKDDGRALRLHQPFKWRVIAPLPRDDEWQFTRDQIVKIAADIEAEAMGTPA